MVFAWRVTANKIVFFNRFNGFVANFFNKHVQKLVSQYAKYLNLNGNNEKNSIINVDIYT